MHIQKESSIVWRNCHRALIVRWVHMNLNKITLIKVVASINVYLSSICFTFFNTCHIAKCILWHVLLHIVGRCVEACQIILLYCFP